MSTSEPTPHIPESDESRTWPGDSVKKPPYVPSELDAEPRWRKPTDSDKSGHHRRSVAKAHQDPIGPIIDRDALKKKTVRAVRNAEDATAKAVKKTTKVSTRAAKGGVSFVQRHPKLSKTVAGAALASTLLRGEPTVEENRQRAQQVEERAAVPVTEFTYENGVVVRPPAQILYNRYPHLPLVQSEVDAVLERHRSIADGMRAQEPQLASEPLAINDDSMVLAYMILAREHEVAIPQDIAQTLLNQMNGRYGRELNPANIEQQSALFTAYVNRVFVRFVDQGRFEGRLSTDDFTDTSRREVMLEMFAQNLFEQNPTAARQYTELVTHFSNNTQARRIITEPTQINENYTETVPNGSSQEEYFESLNPELAQKVREVFEIAREHNVRLEIISSVRSLEEQARIYAQGRSRYEIDAKADEIESETGRADIAMILRTTPEDPDASEVTNAGPGETFHNYTGAVDVAPLDRNGNITFSDMRAYRVIGEAAAAVGLEWGGNFSFFDGGHLQLPSIDPSTGILTIPARLPQVRVNPDVLGYPADSVELEVYLGGIADGNTGGAVLTLEGDAITQVREIDPSAAPAEPVTPSTEPSETGPASSEELALMQTISNTYGSLIASEADRLDIPQEVFMAIIRVEAGGGGFDENGRMVIRFEDDNFLEETGVPVSNSHSSQDAEWAAFEQALEINRSAALAWTSGGAGQALFNEGNAIALGYVDSDGNPNPEAMFEAFQGETIEDGNRAQLLGISGYIEGNGLVDNLQAGDWAGFALRYNGSGYDQHDPPYDVRIANALVVARQFLAQQ